MAKISRGELVQIVREEAARIFEVSRAAKVRGGSPAASAHAQGIRSGPYAEPTVEDERIVRAILEAAKTMINKSFTTWGDDIDMLLVHANDMADMLKVAAALRDKGMPAASRLARNMDTAAREELPQAFYDAASL
jgi:hypothetical protein